MPLARTGVNHRTASVTLQERLALGPVAQRPVLHESRQDPRAPFTELAILSTCNRTEVYAAPVDASDALLELLSNIAGVPPAALLPHTYHETGVDAVRRLCRVAAGLDSMVLGESEIQGQVAAAFRTAEESGSVCSSPTGPLPIGRAPSALTRRTSRDSFGRCSMRASTAFRRSSRRRSCQQHMAQPSWI